MLHAITVIDHEHRERHGKGGACHGGISDLLKGFNGRILPELLCRADARFEWVSGWLWDGHGHGVCNRNHLLACCHAATFLHAGFGVH